MTITHDNIPAPDGTRRQTRQQYHEGTLTRVIDSTIYTLDLNALRGVYKQADNEDRLDHLTHISQLDNEDFKALAQWSRPNEK